MGLETWAPEHRNALSDYIVSGMSYREAAAKINFDFGTSFTRNSAISRGHRSGLKSIVKPWALTPKTIKKPRRPAGESRPRPDIGINARPPRMPLDKIEMRCAEIEPRNLTFDELQRGDCKYPFGDRAPYLFCGHPQLENSSYCTAHFHLSRAHDMRGRGERSPQALANMRRAKMAASVLCEVSKQAEDFQ